MEQTKLVPKRRFKEFQNAHAWEQRKLGDVVEITMGQSPNSDNYTDNPNDHILVQGNADIKNGYVTPRVWTTQVTKQAEKGDLILSVRAPVGDIGKTDYDVVLGRGVAAIKGNEFIFQSLGRMKQTGYWNKLSTGSTFESINSNDIKDASIMIPGAEEQVKIGSFFKRLDSLITLHQRKLEKTKALKSAYLSEMFPAEGERVPKRRFAGFTQPWEQRKLGEIAGQTYGGGTPRTSVKEYWDGSIPWIQSSDLTEGKVSGVIPNKSITEEGLKNSATKLVPRNSIAIITRVGVGKLAFMPFQYTTSQDFLSLSNLKTNPWFTAYASYKKLQSVLNSVQGTSIKGITKEELLSKSIFIPCNKEQAKIGEFFKQLDNLITLHQRKLEKLQNLKKAYLNEMFV
ncbi:restriction endonuclease subunit S [Heyndrickxia coagulans]|uniref:restriction endonuclease subunit S n=1 Tax=Heyndrickxia coagulans TaxID=1398 RepID=UPI002E1E79D0|nr:restriction endonuclease subunit S [Heyndrickxia coagulans]MED4968155.1 restriction endonuclease subunit S [Heyndrickxia coagulans]